LNAAFTQDEALGGVGQVEADHLPVDADQQRGRCECPGPAPVPRARRQSLDVAAVLKAPGEVTPRQIVAGLHSGQAWPLFLAPPAPAMA
jgi:hypothetical protein